MRNVALALISLALGSTYALGSPMEANIPFAFTIGGKTFPPAAYVVEVAGSNQPGVLGIRAKDGTERTMFDTVQMPEKEDPKVIGLVFDKMGDKTYLMEVWGLTDSGRGVKHVVDGKPLEVAKEASRRHLTAIRVIDERGKKSGE